MISVFCVLRSSPGTHLPLKSINDVQSLYQSSLFDLCLILSTLYLKGVNK